MLSRWEIGIKTFLTELRHEFKSLTRISSGLKLLVVVFSIICVDYLAIASIVNAFNLNLPIEAPFVLWVFLSAGSALPSAPGYVGIYQLAAVWTLSLYSVDPSISVAMATVLQITTLFSALMLVLFFNLIAYGMRQNSISKKFKPNN